MANEQVFNDKHPATGTVTSGDGGETHLSEYWAIVLKRRRLILLVTILAGAIAAILTVLQQPLYRASTTLMVEGNAMIPFEIQGSNTTVLRVDPEFVPTQVRLMQSREMAERVVERLRAQSSSGATAGLADDATEEQKRSASLAAAGTIRSGITVTPIRGTSLIEVAYAGSDPQDAAAVANALAQAFIDWNLEARFTVLGQANRFLTTQSAQLQNEIDALEVKLQSYGREKGIVGLARGNVAMQNLEQINASYSAAVNERVAKEARYQSMRNADPASLAGNDSTVAALRTELGNLEGRYNQQLATFKPEFPAMQQLASQIASTRRTLDDAIRRAAAAAIEASRAEYQAALRQEQSLQNIMEGRTDEAFEHNTNAVEYTNILTEIEAKKALLNSIMSQQAETEISSRVRSEGVSNVRVVDRALPPGRPFRPSLPRNLVQGLLAGLAFGIGLAFFLEYLDRSLRTPDQVSQFLGLPTLGIIPAVSGASTVAYGTAYGRLMGKKRSEGDSQAQVELVPHSHPRSTVAEAYRDFRTALMLSQAGGLRSIVMTSALPGEGKTSSAVNLATVMGQIGRRVLIIDADLHKPRLHQIFNVSNRRGLVSVLAESLDPLTAVTTTSIPNVSIVPSGPSAPNPSALLTSNAMMEMLETMSRNFDFVIIDSPPVGPVADAIVLGHHSGGVVICTHAGRTPRELVRRVRDRLAFANVRILGVLINGLAVDPTQKDAYYYKHYGEGYGYTVDVSASGRAAAK